MKMYACYVYERNRKFWDRYLVVADNEILARTELVRRLDEETDTGADNYDVLEVMEYDPR